jgi:predicted RNase H-like HicB family nuclease
MHTFKFVHWEDGGTWIGFLHDYPDYWTQGTTLEDLKEHLEDLYGELTEGTIPGIRKADDRVR